MGTSCSYCYSASDSNIQDGNGTKAPGKFDRNSNERAHLKAIKEEYQEGSVEETNALEEFVMNNKFLTSKLQGKSGTPNNKNSLEQAYELAVFQRAFEAKDVSNMCELLTSEFPVTPQIYKKHQWAENPRTIGAMAAEALAQWASDPVFESDQAFAQALLKGRCIEGLLKLVRSGQIHKVENALLAISFITQLDCHELIAKLQNRQALELMIPYLSATKDGLKEVAAMCCRNTYFNSPNMQQIFIDLQGHVGLIGILSQQREPQAFYGEILLNIEDLLCNEDESIDQVRLAHCEMAGMTETLTMLGKRSNEGPLGEIVVDKARQLLADIREAAPLSSGLGPQK